MKAVACRPFSCSLFIPSWLLFWPHGDILNAFCLCCYSLPDKSPPGDLALISLKGEFQSKLFICLVGFFNTKSYRTAHEHYFASTKNSLIERNSHAYCGSTYCTNFCSSIVYDTQEILDTAGISPLYRIFPIQAVTQSLLHCPSLFSS